MVNGKKVEEYYWVGEYPCYIDNYLAKVTFDEAIKLIRENKDVPMVPLHTPKP